MLYLLTSFLIILINLHLSIQVNLYRSIQRDLKRLNVSCPEYDSCKNRRESDSLLSNACHCERYCTALGTCCLDSRFIGASQLNLKPVCRSLYNGNSYYMVDRCPSRYDAFENFCRREWNGESDLMRIVPVTSRKTSITYKNYFCFRCHETTAEFFYWNVEVTSDFSLSDSNLEKEENNNHILSSLRYDNAEKSWIAFSQKGHMGLAIPVNLAMLVPREIESLARDCELNVISTCSNAWNDRAVRMKCNAYMAIKYVRRRKDILKYQNVHCALCNFENLRNVYCKKIRFFPRKRPFSFRYLLDVNPKNRKDKREDCDEDHVWDPYAKKCKKLTCAFKGYKVKDGKCVKE